MACYGRDHLLAPFCHHPVSWDARYREKPSWPHPVLAGLHASPLSGAENLRRTCLLDPGGQHSVTFPPLAEGELLEYPYASSWVGRGSPAYLAAAQGRDSSIWWVMAVRKPSGERKIPWSKKDLKMSIIPGLAVSALRC